MKTVRVLRAGACALLLAGPAQAGGTDMLILPEIVLTPADGTLRIEGFVGGIGDGDVDATLSIVHDGAGGSATVRQGRTVVLDGGPRVSIAATALNVGPGSRLRIELTVEAGDRVLASSRTEIGPAD